MQFCPRIFLSSTRNQNNSFMTSIYQKKTFTCLFTKWESFIPQKYKINLTRSLTYLYFRLCSSGSLLQFVLDDPRELLLHNGYPQGIINYDINDVLNKGRHQPNNPLSTDIVILLPCLCLQSNQIAKCSRPYLYSCINLMILARTSLIVYNNSELLVL